MKRLRAHYGGGPAHLLATLASLALAGAAVVGWAQRAHDFERVLIWFAAAIVLHDMVLLPIYSIVDRNTVARLPARVAVHIRVPALISAFVLVTLSPTVLGFGARIAHNASGLPQHGYFAKWLALTGVLFALSGLAFAVGARRGPNADGAPATD